MSFKTNAEIFRFPPRLLFDATLANYAALWTSEFRNSFANSLIVSVASTVAVAGDRRAGGLCAVALDDARRRHDHAVDPGQPHGAADRLHHPLLPGLSPSRAARHADRPHHHLPHLQPVAGDLDDAAVLRPAAALARGGGLDRRRHDVAGLLPHHPAALRARPGGDGDPLLPVRLERLLLRPDPDPHRGDDGAGGGGQFHELRRLGMGPHRRRRHHDHAAGAGLLLRRAALSGAAD